MFPLGSLRRTSLTFAVLAVAAACSTKPPGAEPPPRAEFLVTAGDSAFWISTDAQRFRVRRAPLSLANVGGRFYELYVADDDRSYFDALLVGQRIYRRDLISGDSVQVFEDARVRDIALKYAAAHPDERPLKPDEDGSDDPHTVATSDAGLLDVVGPLLSFELHIDVDISNVEDSHVARHAVVDLRAGGLATLASVFGDSAAKRLIADGRAAYRSAIDSVRRVGGARARRAARVIDALRFDPASFDISDMDGAPAVAFWVPGEGVAGGGLTLELPRLRAPKPAWWPEIAATIPQVDADSSSDLWSGAPYDVIARYDTTGEFATLIVRDSSRREWSAARLPTPAHRVYRLDAPGVDSTARHAPARAFDESTLYSGSARTVRGPSRQPPTFVLASFTSRRAPATRPSSRSRDARLDRH